VACRSSDGGGVAPELPPVVPLNDSIWNCLWRLPTPSGLWSNGESRFIGGASRKIWREIPMFYGGNFVPIEKLEGKESVVHWGKGNWRERKVWRVPKKF
jgi:hypothetical protein